MRKEFGDVHSPNLPAAPITAVVSLYGIVIGMAIGNGDFGGSKPPDSLSAGFQT